VDDEGEVLAIISSIIASSAAASDSL